MCVVINENVDQPLVHEGKYFLCLLFIAPTLHNKLCQCWGLPLILFHWRRRLQTVATDCARSTSVPMPLAHVINADAARCNLRWRQFRPTAAAFVHTGACWRVWSVKQMSRVLLHGHARHCFRHGQHIFELIFDPRWISTPFCFPSRADVVFPLRVCGTIVHIAGIRVMVILRQILQNIVQLSKLLGPRSRIRCSGWWCRRVGKQGQSSFLQRQAFYFSVCSCHFNAPSF